MKTIISLFCGAILLSGCASVRVTQTNVATGAANPKVFYIRPFPVTGPFKGHHGYLGERDIHESLAGQRFAEALQEELSKLAPAKVLTDDETPETGWLVDGELEWVHAGSPLLRYFWKFGPAGRSHLIAHVRITDVEGVSTAKGGSARASGKVIYDFTLAGGSKATGVFGSTTAPGVGYATPFDFRNAAERVAMMLSTDPHRYGLRTTPAIR